jgi:RHS repeat-associated protein
VGVSSYSNNASNELTSTSTASYTYDNNGNTHTKVVGSNTTTYAWDYENRMTSVTLPGSGGTVSFKYDPFGRRIYKSSSSATSVYAYDGDNLVEETNSSGTAVVRYSQSLNIDEPLATLRSSTTSYYEQDGIGSVTSLSNGAGALAQTYTFDSFGKTTASSGSLTNPFQYTTRELDPETSAYYYRARYYDPSFGRFISEDPSGFAGGDDFYVYTENNPATIVDPYGLDSSTWSGLKDLGQWGLGLSGANSHSNDSVTADLTKSPAMDDIRTQLKEKNCAPGRYCGQLTYKQAWNYHNYNLVVESVGSFCANISVSGGQMQVDAFNEWGFQSGTRIPGTNYHSPTLQDMIFNGAKRGMPSSILNNTLRGPMKVQRFWYHWSEKSTCCSN